MQIAARIGTMARRGAPLPYSREVKFLRSSGTQWIIPGVAADGIDIWIKPEDVYLNPSIGAWNGGSRSYGGIGFTNFSSRGWNFASYPDTVNSFDMALDFAHVVWRNGIVTLHEESYECRFDFYDYSALFGRTTSQDRTTVEPRSCDIGRTTLYIGETPVRQFIPVLDLSGRPAMYDEVSEQFFYNQGTGEFAWGELDAASGAISTEGGGTKCLTPRRSYRRLARPSARFCAHSQEWEVAA